MMKRTFKWLALVLALLLCLIPLSAAIGDAGNFGGGDDFGGGGDWGGGSSWSGGSYDSDYDGGGGGIGIGGVIVIIIIVVIVTLAKRGKAGKGNAAGSAQQPFSPAPPSTAGLRPLFELQQKDPAFSAEALQQQFSNLYVRMQNAWTAKDFEPMRPYFSDGLYAQFNNQLQEYVRDNKTNYVSNIAVLSVNILGWTPQGPKDAITARVKVRVNDYVLSDESGTLLQGSKTASVFMEYEWIAQRASDAKSGEDLGKAQNVPCPSCAAPLSLNESAKCPYCGSLVTIANKGWALSSIRGISKQTGGK
ncbi:MAG: Tim44-like domain-containing protein [Clostridiales bacterium]|nr:Tim44-like domain-containing protein [Clostridiales bacterium]